MYLLQEQSQPINTAGNAAALIVTFLSNAILVSRDPRTVHGDS